jgi:hypothetical protein
MGKVRATMKEPFYTYYIRSEWQGCTEAPASIGAKFVKTLDAMSSIDPLLANWEIIDARALSSLSLAGARPRIARIIENNVTRDDFGKPAPVYGYHGSARTSIARDARNVRFRIHAGGKLVGNAMLEFGEHDVAPDLAIITYPLFKAALLAINAVWLPAWACAQCRRSGAVQVPFELGGAQAYKLEGVPQVPDDLTFPDSVFHIPWLAYISEKLAAGLELTPEIVTKRTPDGGLLMSAAEDRLDPNNRAHVRRARILAETLLACTGYQLGGTTRI